MKKLLFCFLVLVILFVFFAFVGNVRLQLIFNKWIGEKVTTGGLYGPSELWQGYKPVLSFRPLGFASIKLGDKTQRTLWWYWDDFIYFYGPSCKTWAYVSKDGRRGRIYDIYFKNLNSKNFRFIKRKDSLKLIKRLENYRLNFEKIGSGPIDFSQASYFFLERMVAYDFESFTPLELNDQNKEELKDRYFSGVLGLGLEKSNKFHLEYEDTDGFLEAYERYVFNSSLEEEERKELAGQIIYVPYHIVYDYASSRTYIEDPLGTNPNRLADIDLLTNTERFDVEQGFAMEVYPEAPISFEGELLEAWEYGELILIHMIYADGGQGWFLLEENPRTDCYRYKFFSYYDGELGG